jgi:hypothetical protein
MKLPNFLKKKSKFEMIVGVVLIFVFLIMFAYYKRIILLLSLIALELFSTYFEKKFQLEPGPDFILCGIILFTYTAHYIYAWLLVPMILVSKLVFGRFKPRHLFKPGIYAIILYLTLLLRDFDILAIGIVLTIVRYVIEYLLEFVTKGMISTDRLIPRFLRIIYAWIFFSVFGEILVRLIL